MTRQAKRIYQLLLDNPNVHFSYEQIARHIGTRSRKPKDVIALYIHTLRVDAPLGYRIRNKYGCGYWFEPVSASPRGAAAAPVPIG